MPNVRSGQARARRAANAVPSIGSPFSANQRESVTEDRVPTPHISPERIRGLDSGYGRGFRNDRRAGEAARGRPCRIAFRADEQVGRRCRQAVEHRVVRGADGPAQPRLVGKRVQEAPGTLRGTQLANLCPAIPFSGFRRRVNAFRGTSGVGVSGAGLRSGPSADSSPLPQHERVGVGEPPRIR